MTLTLSVVVAQGGGDVTQCLASLRRLRAPAHEVVVVVPTSTAEAAACGVVSQVQSVLPKAQVLSGDRPWQLGLTVARGDVVAFIDHDALVEPDWATEILRPYEDAAVVAVGGRVSHGESDDGARGLVGRLLPDGRLITGFTADLGRVLDVDHLAGAVVTARRDAVQAAGGVYGEGTMARQWQAADLSLRLRRHGRLVYQSSASARTPAPELRRQSLRELYAARRDHVMLLTRNVGWPLSRYYVSTVVRAQQAYAVKIRRWLRDPVASRRPLGHRIRKIGQAVSSCCSEILGLAAGVLVSALMSPGGPRELA